MVYRDSSQQRYHFIASIMEERAIKCKGNSFSHQAFFSLPLLALGNDWADFYKCDHFCLAACVHAFFLRESVCCDVHVEICTAFINTSDVI